MWIDHLIVFVFFLLPNSLPKHAIYQISWKGEKVETNFSVSKIKGRLAAFISRRLYIFTQDRFEMP